ncbi:MAG: GNAT family N-acetyltransferase [bacterium]|nr:GNAT family N-acetyltransferase [bacterium]
MIIREYEEKNAEALEKCIIELQEFEKNLQPDFRPKGSKVAAAYRKYLIKKIKSNHGKIFVAEADKKIAGFIAILLEKQTSPCMAIKENAYITDLIVLSKYRKSGIASALLKHAEKFAIKSKMNNIFLDVMFNNKLALNFYHSKRFKNRGITLLKKLK